MFNKIGVRKIHWKITAMVFFCSPKPGQYYLLKILIHSCELFCHRTFEK